MLKSWRKAGTVAIFARFESQRRCDISLKCLILVTCDRCSDSQGTVDCSTCKTQHGDVCRAVPRSHAVSELCPGRKTSANEYLLRYCWKWVTSVVPELTWVRLQKINKTCGDLIWLYSRMNPVFSHIQHRFQGNCCYRVMLAAWPKVHCC